MFCWHSRVCTSAISKLSWFSAYIGDAVITITCDCCAWLAFTTHYYSILEDSDATVCYGTHLIKRLWTGVHYHSRSPEVFSKHSCAAEGRSSDS